MSNEVRGTGFIYTGSREESESKIKELVELGFITNFGTILDDGFLFFYTDKGAKFAKTVAKESREIGVSPKEYVDIFVQLRQKEEMDGEDMGNSQ